MMKKPSPAILARLAPVMVLVSCATTEPTVVETAAAPQKETVAVTAVPKTISEPEVPAPQDDGLRLPDMVTMPGDEEFRSAAPSLPSMPSGTGAVIARPPTDPPPRPKPTDAE